MKQFLALALVSSLICEGRAAVKLIRTPDQGIQPQAVVDDQGIAHMIYLKGDPKSGEILYTRLEQGEKFRAPMTVNPPGKGAVAIGNIRGPQLAIGKNGRAHVTWMGGGQALYFTRLNDEGSVFEPPRNVVTWAGGLDGGGTLSADGKGNVFVAWNGSPPGNKAGELGRAIFVARSTDEGGTFSREERVTSTNSGVCACCGMRGYADAKGNLFFLYRATDGKSRDMTLLASSDGGKNFRSITVSKWAVNACPMSSSTMTETGGRLLAATEKSGQVVFSQIDPQLLALSETTTAPGLGRRKHPVIAVNSRGERLLAWTENMGWGRGGSLAWQLYDSAGKVVGEKGSAPGVPVWSLITAVSGADGDFALIY